jgi:hypothetical protein
LTGSTHDIAVADVRSVESSELLQIAVDLLESNVAPALPDGSAQRVFWVCIGLLDNLVGRIEDKRSLLEEEASLLASLLMADLPPRSTGRIGDPNEISLRELRASLATRFRACPWRSSPDTWSAEVEQQEWLHRCQNVLSQINATEISLLKSTRYGLANGLNSRRD